MTLFEVRQKTMNCQVLKHTISRSIARSRYCTRSLSLLSSMRGLAREKQRANHYDPACQTLVVWLPLTQIVTDRYHQTSFIRV